MYRSVRCPDMQTYMRMRVCTALRHVRMPRQQGLSDGSEKAAESAASSSPCDNTDDGSAAVHNGKVKILQRPAVITVLPAMSSSSAENLITPLNFTDHLGSKVKVRWSETDEYEGVIDDLRVSKDCLQVHVTYDDGEKQWEPVDKNGKVTYIIDDIPLLRACLISWSVHRLY